MICAFGLDFAIFRPRSRKDRSDETPDLAKEFTAFYDLGMDAIQRKFCPNNGPSAALAKRRIGANLEFRSREKIQRAHGRVENFLDSDARPLGMFTDDTEMTLALAVSLI